MTLKTLKIIPNNAKSTLQMVKNDKYLMIKSQENNSYYKKCLKINSPTRNKVIN